MEISAYESLVLAALSYWRPTHGEIILVAITSGEGLSQSQTILSPKAIHTFQWCTGGK